MNFSDTEVFPEQEQLMPRCTATAALKGWHIPCQGDADDHQIHYNEEYELIWTGPLGPDVGPDALDQ